MENRQVTKKLTFQLRLDIGWRKILLDQRNQTNKSMKTLVEEILADYYPGFEKK